MRRRRASGPPPRTRTPTCTGRSAAAAATSASSRRSRSSCTRFGPGGRVLGHLLPDRGGRPGAARLAGLRRAGAGRGHLGVRDITFPANPELPEAIHDRPGVIGRRLRRRRRRGPEDHGAPARAGHAAVRHVGPDAVRRGADRLRPAVPARPRCGRTGSPSTSDELSDGAIEDRGEGRDRPSPLTLVNIFAHGRRDRQGGRGGHGVRRRGSRRTWSSIDGMWSDDRRTTRPTWRGCARRGTRSSEYGTGEVYLNFTGLADEDPSAGVDSALGRNMARLAEVKAKYDPDNFFRVNDNIARRRLAERLRPYCRS